MTATSNTGEESTESSLLRRFYELLEPIRLDRPSDDAKLEALMAETYRLLNPKKSVVDEPDSEGGP